MDTELEDVTGVVVGVLLAVALVLTLAGVERVAGYEVLASGRTALGFLSAGNFSVGVLSTGIFSVGVFAAGIFSVGVFAIGIFSVGVFSFGVYAVGAYAIQRRLASETEPADGTRSESESSRRTE